MKIRMFALFLSVFSLFFLVSCGKKDPADTKSTENTEKQTEETETMKLLEPGKLTFTSELGERDLYCEAAKNYLRADIGTVNVKDYYVSGLDDPAVPVTLTWQTNDDTEGLRLAYGLKRDYTDAITVTLDRDAVSYDLCNLYKGATYYVKLTELCPDGYRAAEFSFTTSSLGPRPVSFEGAYNIRDLGGYETKDGVTAQGLLYRGGELAPDVNYFADVQLTAAGAKAMAETLGIKTEIDLRSASESETPISESLIPGARLLYLPFQNYKAAIDDEQWRNAAHAIFSLLADPANYPVFFHCTGGADRTGTLAYLINAFLGVSDTDLIHDYEFTSFSHYAINGDVRGTKQSAYSDHWKAFMTALNRYEGKNAQEKVTAYLLDIGVKQAELDNIRKIMHGEEAKTLTSEEIDPDTLRADKCFDFGGKNVLVNKDGGTVGNTSTGYERTVEFSLKTPDMDENGSLVVLIGSYGFHLRGGELRAAVRTASGELTADYGRRDYGDMNTLFCDSSAFLAGNKLRMSVKIVDGNPQMTVEIPGVVSGTYEFPGRIEDEIPAEQAFVYVTANNRTATPTVEISG